MGNESQNQPCPPFGPDTYIITSGPQEGERVQLAARPVPTFGGAMGRVYPYHGMTPDGHFHGERAKADKGARKAKRKRDAIAKASRRRNRG